MNTKAHTIFSRLRIYGVMTGIILALFSCNDDDAGDSHEQISEPEVNNTVFFISASGETSEYIVTTDNLEEGDMTISGNGEELDLSGYTWLFNDNPSVAIGLIYQQGDPGIGLGYKLDDNDELSELGQFQISSRFTSYGFFENYAVTSVGGQTPVDADGNTLLDDHGDERTDASIFNFFDENKGLTLQSKTINTLNITGNGDQATFSGIVDMGNGEFLSGMVLSQAKDESETGGSSTGTVNYPDSVWVAAFDANLNLKRIYRDDRISYASGRFRSRYYSQISKDDDGNIYVFSGSYESSTTKPCGALRINRGADDFDDDYYYNIEELSDGYHFKRLWHITADYFLLEFYNDQEPSIKGASTRYGIVKMEDKTFSWIGGDFPSLDEIVSTGEPTSYKGKMYMPIAMDSEYPKVYIIDPVTATATKGITITATQVNAIGVLSNSSD